MKKRENTMITLEQLAKYVSAKHLGDGYISAWTGEEHWLVSLDTGQVIKRGCKSFSPAVDGKVWAQRSDGKWVLCLIGTGEELPGIFFESVCAPLNNDFPRYAQIKTGALYGIYDVQEMRYAVPLMFTYITDFDFGRGLFLVGTERNKGLYSAPLGKLVVPMQWSGILAPQNGPADLLKVQEGDERTFLWSLPHERLVEGLPEAFNFEFLSAELAVIYRNGPRPNGFCRIVNGVADLRWGKKQ